MDEMEVVPWANSHIKLKSNYVILRCINIGNYGTVNCNIFKHFDDINNIKVQLN